MKRGLFILFSVLFLLPVMAKRKNVDSVNMNDTLAERTQVVDTLASVKSVKTEENRQGTQSADTIKKKRTIYSWRYSGQLAVKEDAGLDTSMFNFYVNNPALRKTISLQTLGTLGAPAQSAIFVDRENKTDFLFFQPFQIYYKPSNEILYFNTKTPFSYINYYGGGTNRRDNRHLEAILSINVKKRFNFGLYGDWTKAYGAYTSLSTRNYNAGYFMSYDGQHSQFGFSVSLNGYENYESGGFINDRYITDPKNTGNMDAVNIPVHFNDNAWSKVRNWNMSFNYRYNIGIEKDVEITPDSFATEIIPVTSIIYTFSSESDWRRFYERSNMSAGVMVDSFYHNYRLSDERNLNRISTTDSTRYWQMKHTLGVSLNEEYNTLMKFGFAAYAVLKTKKYTYLDEAGCIKAGEVSPQKDSLGYILNSSYSRDFRNKFGVGAILSKHQGPVFTYQVYGEYYFLDEKQTASSFEIGGNLHSSAMWGKQNVEIGANVKFERYCPDFFEDYYFSNHIKWDNDFENKQDFIVNGFVNFPSFAFYKDFGIEVRADFRNLNNYIFWNKYAKPEQCEDNVQVLTLTAKERVRVWRLHWDNELTFQQSSEQKVLPLPQLCWFSSAYLLFERLFKVLNVQIGVDMRWNSSYYAPNYMPATGQFFVQDVDAPDYQKYGKYLYMDAFINFQLKNARFYVEFNHFNSLWTKHYNSLYMRGYAMDPKYVKFGLSFTLAR